MININQNRIGGLPLRGGSFSIPNKTECLQHTKGKIEQIPDGQFVLKDSVGKVDIVPQEGNCYEGNEASAWVRFDNDLPDGNLYNHTVKFKTITKTADGVKGVFGATNDLGHRFDIYLNNNVLYVGNPLNSTTTNITSYATQYDVDVLLDVSVTFGSGLGEVAVVTVNKVPLTTGTVAPVGLSVSKGDFYFLTIGAAWNSSTEPPSTYMGNGKIGDVQIYNPFMKLLHYWHCDETGGTTCFDAVGTAHGTINTATPESFHTKDIRFKSYQNELGYSVLDGAHTVEMGYVANVLYPIALDEDGNSTDLDIYDNTPTYLGKTKNNLIVGGSNCIELDGANYVLFKDLSAEVIGYKIRFRPDTLTQNGCLIGSKNTVGIYLRGGYNMIRLQTSVGSLDIATDELVDNEWNTIRAFEREGSIVVIVNDGEEHTQIASFADIVNNTMIGAYYHWVVTSPGLFFEGFIDYAIIETPNKTYTYNFGEGEGVTIHDTTPETNPTYPVVNGTLMNTPTWTIDDEATPFNMMNGFNFDGTIKIPAQTGNTGLDVLGDPLLNPAYKSGEGQNNSENYYLEYPTPSLYQADELLTPNIMYDHTARLPIPILYSEKQYDYNSDNVMFSNAEEKAWRNIMVYSDVQTGVALNKIYKLIKKPEEQQGGFGGVETWVLESNTSLMSDTTLLNS